MNYEIQKQHNNGTVWQVRVVIFVIIKNIWQQYYYEWMSTTTSDVFLYGLIAFGS